MNGFSSPLRRGLWVAAIYGLIGILWIAFSDRLVTALTDDLRLLTWLQTVKGWAFVTLSALVILVLVRQAVHREVIAVRALRWSEEHFRVFFDQAAVGLAEVDPSGRWRLVNPCLCELLGYTAEELVQRTSLDITPPEHHAAEIQSMQEMFDGTKCACSREKIYLRKDGTPVWVQLSANLVRDDNGAPKFFIVVIQEIGDRKRAEAGLQAALAEKEVLLAEIHHRVRNNLQLVVSLLSLEAAKHTDVRLRAAVENMLARIQAMGLIHQQLYQNQNYDEIAFDDYIRDLCQALVTAIAPPTVGFRYVLEPVRCTLNAAVPMGLILVELVVNALQHAFPAERRGTVTIRLSDGGGRIYLTVVDDGIGLSPDTLLESTGLTIVRMLTTQLGGRFDARPGRNGGTETRLDFPVA